MSEKQDHYKVLGVNKNASPEEIKKAFKQIAMKCHPDMVRNKTDAEKKEAAEKLRLAKEANDVLSDPSKRATYDRYGHSGVDNLKHSGSQGESCRGETPVNTVRKSYSAESTFDFFERLAEKHNSSPCSKPRETPQERQARAAEERRKAREALRNETSATPSVSETFREVSEKAADAAERLKEVALPVEALQSFRENLHDFLKQIDAAIDRARKNGGPRP